MAQLDAKEERVRQEVELAVANQKLKEKDTQLDKLAVEATMLANILRRCRLRWWD